MKIKTKNLSFKYQGSNNLIIDDITFDIKKNTINVLLGLNGCGKTTLIKLLAGIITPIRGTIYYEGEDISKLSDYKKSKKRAYVAQTKISSNDDLVFDYLNYSFFNNLKFYEGPSDEKKEEVKKIAEEFKITRLLNKKMGNISGGEKQIVSICAALLQKTSIILLDEPTSALDLKNQNLVLNTLKTISKDKTIILSSHNPNHALFLDANIAIINKGKIETYDVASKVINKENLEFYGDGLCLSKDLPYEEVSFRKIKK